MLAYKKFIALRTVLKFLIIVLVVIIVINFLYKQYYFRDNVFLNQDELVLGASDSAYKVINNDNLLEIRAQKSFYKNKQEIVFHNIKGYIEDKSYEKIVFSAQKAVFNKEDKNLHFIGTVNILAHNNFTLYADQAFYWLEKNIINGNGNIQFHNNMGHILAQNFVFNLAKKNYIFTKDIMVTNNNSASIKSDKLYIDDIKYNMKVLDSPQYQDNNIKIMANEFFISYEKLSDDNFSVNKIIAYDNVNIISDNSLITGNMGEYNLDHKKVLITDNVTFTQDNSIIKGENLVYNIIDGSFKILSKQQNKVRINLKKYD